MDHRLVDFPFDFGSPTHQMELLVHLNTAFLVHFQGLDRQDELAKQLLPDMAVRLVGHPGIKNGATTREVVAAFSYAIATAEIGSVDLLVWRTVLGSAMQFTELMGGIKRYLMVAAFGTDITAEQLQRAELHVNALAQHLVRVKFGLPNALSGDTE